MLKPQEKPRRDNDDEKDAADKNAGGSRSVRRALGIFEFMRERAAPVTIAEIIAALSIPKSTAYELVNVLHETGYLAPSGRRGVRTVS